MTAAGRYQRFRAPQADGEILSVPPAEQFQGLLRNNLKALATNNKLWGKPLVELASLARQEVLNEAWQYTRSYANVPERQTVNAPLIFTGHQPEIVHPGVWLKNFAAARLAQASSGIAINLIIDSDLSRKTAVSIPNGSASELLLSSVEYDAWHGELPYEQREILDLACWESFGERATKTLGPLVDGPLASQWWIKHAVQERTTTNLGLALAQARHRQELEWGSESWEIPQSLICQTTSFRWFAVHLLQEAQRFRTSYNDSLQEYRVVHRLRNPAQPMPDLLEDEGWVETPFWIWTNRETKRRALYTRPKGEQLLLSDLAGWQGELPAAIESAIECLATGEQQGIKIRTRALATTLYTRLLLADMFIHGIGGSKYDQVTDAICARFFEIQLPPYATLSGTLRLPIEHPTVAPHQARQLRQQLRNLEYHPEKHLGNLALEHADQQQLEKWTSQKMAWVKTTKTAANAAQRHQEIVASNQALQTWTAPIRTQWEQELAGITKQSRVNQILESREYPFCLFPPEQLRDFLLDF